VDAYLLDWLNLALRWFHLVVGIGWIGTSLYFMWLDASLERPARLEPSVEGEVWLVHSGGFYRIEKRLLGPGEVPARLHWFKWEAALTWISGFALLAIVYYVTGGVYLVDPAVSRLGPGPATALGIGTLAAGWLVYDFLWRSPLGREPARIATWLSWALLVATAWGLTRLLSGRAAFIHVGAILGTLMAANVWAHIVPAQREMITATGEGRAPDLSLGRHAKRRSAHNSYMTFPVIFTMLSNHYPLLYAHRLNWLVLCLLVLVGAGVRHLMITHERGRPAFWTWAPVAAAIAALAWLTAPGWLPAPTATPAGGRAVPFAVARGIVELRCASCHSARPTDDVFRVAPNGVAFDTPAAIRERADAIKARTVVQKTMPLGNKTGMTDEERALLGRWIDEGARVD
jgi:uncharacterized membrane protein